MRYSGATGSPAGWQLRLALDAFAERGGEPGWLPLGFAGRRWSVVVEKAAQRSNTAAASASDAAGLPISIWVGCSGIKPEPSATAANR